MSDPKEGKYDDRDVGGRTMTAEEFLAIFRRSSPAAPRLDVALELTSPLLPGSALKLDAVFGA